MRIRPARLPEEWPTILTMRRHVSIANMRDDGAYYAAHYGADGGLLRGKWEKWIAGGSFQIDILADDTDEPRGMAAWGYRAGRNEPGLLEALYVAPELRGQGMGRMMLAHVAARLTLLGADMAELFVSPLNRTAYDLYGRDGWRDTGPVAGEPRVHRLLRTLLPKIGKNDA